MHYTVAIAVAVAAATAYGLLGVCFQIAGKQRLEILPFLFWKQLIGTFLAGGLWWFMGATAWHGDLVLMALLGSFSYVSTTGAYLMATRDRTIGASWTVLNLSVVLPIAVSVVWFGEPLTAWKALGVMLTLGSVALVSGAFQRRNWQGINLRWAKWISLAFFLNGWLATLMRFVRPNEGYAFTFAFYAISFLLVSALSAALKTRPTITHPTLLAAGGGAATHLGGMVLTLLALSLIASSSISPGTVVYPITNGLVIPIGVILGMLILRERPEPGTVSGIVLGMAALILFCF